MYEFIINIIKKYKLEEFIKFVIVGFMATAISYVIYYFLQKKINENIAYTIGYGTSFCFNFIASNLFTFKTKPNAQKGFRFAFAHFMNYLIQLGLLNLFILVNIPKEYAPIPIYIIAIPLNFIFVRLALKNKNIIN